MTDTETYFDENGYVVLQNVLTKENCDELVQHMFKLYEDGKLIKDAQCPLSDAVYGDPIFDNLLQHIAIPLGKAIGKKLLPTYSYARIYRNGDTLKKHLDRAACEISTTLTLGYDAKANWPIHISNKEGTNETAVTMEPGEMAAYKGTEMLHWRKEFKGNWHIQVFLHFVDADGPHADQAMDGRQNIAAEVVTPEQVNQVDVNSINLKSDNEVTIPDPIFGGMILPSTDIKFPGYFPINSETFPGMMLTDLECDKIIQIAKDSYSSSASVGTEGKKNKGNITKSIRSAEVFSVENTEENRWLFKKVASAVSVVNALHFEYDITSINHSLQLIHYASDADIPGHYDWHVDAGNGSSATRKISFTAQLSDPESYTGCDLIIDNHGTKIEAVRERGSISLFPSYMPHVVSPIETGDRYALVIWINGSRRFR
jgi:predicted 2-oxoglutarate/Fe(II)-dependent dioxygenase YbiX